MVDIVPIKPLYWGWPTCTVCDSVLNVDDDVDFKGIEFVPVNGRPLIFVFLTGFGPEVADFGTV